MITQQNNEPRRTNAPGEPSQSQSKGINWRKNVLTVLGIAYAALLLIFVVMVLWGVEPKMAYDSVDTPFVALIGGTLAIAKDLL